MSLLVGQLWNWNQPHVLKPHKIQKEIDLILSLKGWMKNRKQRTLLRTKHTLTNNFFRVNILIECYWLVFSLESQCSYFTISDLDLSSIKFPGKTPLGGTWAADTSRQAASIEVVLCLQESRVWHKENKLAANDKTPVVHHVPASSFPSPFTDLGWLIAIWGFPIYTKRQLLREEKTGQMNKCVG